MPEPVTKAVTGTKEVTGQLWESRLFMVLKASGYVC
jgi:hypothetical protein